MKDERNTSADKYVTRERELPNDCRDVTREAR